MLLKLRRAVVPAPVLYFARKPPKGTKPDKIYPEKQRFAVYEEMERLSVQAYPELLPLAQADKMNARRHILLGMLVVPELIDTSLLPRTASGAPKRDRGASEKPRSVKC